MNPLNSLIEKARPAINHWLLVVVAFFPFQLRILDAWTPPGGLSAFLRHLDELTIAILALPALLWMVSRKRRSRPLDLLLFLLSLVGLIGLASGLINRVPIAPLLFGTFDYVKNFLVLFIFAVFVRDVAWLERALRLLVFIAVLLGVVAVYQEAVGIIGGHILEDPVWIADWSMFPTDTEFDWRFGMLRVPSLTNHPNTLALFTLLVLAFYLFGSRKVNPYVFSALFVNIIFSGSKIAYLGFLILTGWAALEKRRWLIIPALIPALLLFMMTFPEAIPKQAEPALVQTDPVKKGGEESVTAKPPANTVRAANQSKTPEFMMKVVPRKPFRNPYRVHTRNLALAIWKDHKIFGAGPGRFGGVISVKYGSPLYESYGADPYFLETFIRGFYSIDQFWPQILAELGAAGMSAFLAFLLALGFFLFRIYRRSMSGLTKNLACGLVACWCAIFVYTLGSGLNVTPFIFTFAAFAGVILGNATGLGTHDMR